MAYHVPCIGADKEAIAAQIRARGLHGILLCAPENVYYTSGLPAVQGSGNPILFALKNQLPSFVYIGADGKTTLLCWVGATLGFTFDVEDVRSFFNYSSALDELQDFLQATLSAGARVGIESSCPFSVTTKLADLAAEITISDDLLLEARLVKNEAEIALLRQATAIVEETVADLSALVRPGISRLWLIREAKRLMLAHGADGIGHTTIAFGASNPEIAVDETLVADQLVTLDLGAVVAGYVSDNRRLLYTGSVPESLRALHTTMCDIVGQVGQALRPGVPFADLYAFAADLYTARNLPPFFINAGHSIGLQTEEAWLSFDSPHSVQAGMILNVELYSALLDKSGGHDGSNIGDEETFLVTDADVIRLTQSGPSIREV